MMILMSLSLSSRTIVYKGMFLVGQLRQFFTDLQDQDYESAIATRTFQILYEYNIQAGSEHIQTVLSYITVRSIPFVGNADKMLAREETMESDILQGEFHKVLPVINTEWF